MIGTIRKHSGWLWAIIISATIFSFVFLWGTNQARMGGGNSSVSLGSVYGKKVSREDYLQGQRDFVLSYWFHSGKWPDATTVSTAEMDQQIYLSLMLEQKAEKLGINASEDTLAEAAKERLAAFGRNGQVVTLDALVEQVLAPKGFNAADFERFVRNDLIIQELIQALGLPGKLVTPQEAAAAYQRENEELSAQVVFFASTNYLLSVRATPAMVGQFYTNYQAQYRLPDRVQISYVAFAASNYLAQSKAEWAKTNLSDFVENYLHKLGENYKGATNAEQARAIITDELIKSRAMTDARKDAGDLVSPVFAIEPALPENLATVAKQKGLTLHTTAPFAKSTGPAEFESTGDFTKTAFDLNADSPLAGPVTDGDSVYVMALAKTLPSEIPPYDQIRARVAADYQLRESIRMAQQSGAAFAQILTNQLAAGKSFASVCAANGHPALALPPFSISSEDMPELGGHATLAQIKQIAFTSSVGRSSGFEPTQDGGFILLVQARLPVDQAKLTADLPQFTQTLRRTRQNEAFNQWVQTEANTGLQLPPSAKK